MGKVLFSQVYDCPQGVGEGVTLHTGPWSQVLSQRGPRSFSGGTPPAFPKDTQQTGYGAGGVSLAFFTQEEFLVLNVFIIIVVDVDF